VQRLPAERRVKWLQTFRIIPSRYPTVDLFERVSDPSDLETLAMIEGLTNDRLRDQIGNIRLVPPEDRISGPGASPIMAAFTHIGRASRFTDGSYGVYYASNRFEGALAEVVYNHEKFLRRTNEPDTRVEMRLYIGTLSSALHDVRGGWPEVHDGDSHQAAQTLGAKLRALSSNGIVYDGVRLRTCANIAIFKPKAIAATGGKAHVAHGGHFYLHWNGEKIFRFIKVGDPDWQTLRD